MLLWTLFLESVVFDNRQALEGMNNSVVLVVVVVDDDDAFDNFFASQLLQALACRVNGARRGRGDKA